LEWNKDLVRVEIQKKSCEVDLENVKVKEREGIRFEAKAVRDLVN
jgi:hypothetical protein